MARLLVRDLDPGPVEALRKKAAESGRSAEAEHRAIPEQALMRPVRRTLAEAPMAMPDVGRDDDFMRHRDEGDGHRVPD